MVVNCDYFVHACSNTITYLVLIVLIRRGKFSEEKTEWGSIEPYIQNNVSITFSNLHSN